jgi:hypothetical protein
MKKGEIYYGTAGMPHVEHDRNCGVYVGTW